MLIHLYALIAFKWVDQNNFSHSEKWQKLHYIVDCSFTYIEQLSTLALSNETYRHAFPCSAQSPDSISSAIENFSHHTSKEKGLNTKKELAYGRSVGWP